MSRSDPKNTPDLWGPSGTHRVEGSADPGVYINENAFADARGGIFNFLVWHWHTPTDGEARWQGSGLGLHTLVSLDPLHIEPSLGCDHGCPNHGFIREGKWIDV